MAKIPQYSAGQTSRQLIIPEEEPVEQISLTDQFTSSLSRGLEQVDSDPFSHQQVRRDFLTALQPEPGVIDREVHAEIGLAKINEAAATKAQQNLESQLIFDHFGQSDQDRADLAGFLNSFKK